MKPPIRVSCFLCVLLIRDMLDHQMLPKEQPGQGRPQNTTWTCEKQLVVRNCLRFQLEEFTLYLSSLVFM